MILSAIQEDYLEAIYRLSRGNQGVRSTDIAERLGCRLPTVTRTVRKLAEMKLIEHESRGLVALTRRGLLAAEEITHRHADSVAFLVNILGLSKEKAEEDACQIEHGLSPLAAQRLHEFLEYIENLDERDRKVIDEFARRVSSTASDFEHLPKSKTAGWRG